MFINLWALHWFSILLYITGSNALKCAYHLASSSSPLIVTSVEKCVHEDDFCFAFWKFDPFSPLNISRFHLISRGCSNNTWKERCHKSQCAFYQQHEQILNDTAFCCCSTNLCNSNFSIIAIKHYRSEQAELEIASVKNHYTEEVENNSSFILLSFVVFVLFIFAVIVLYSLCYKCIYANSKMANHHKTLKSRHLIESQALLPSASAAVLPVYNMDNLSFHELICEGKFSNLWRGELHNVTVAIKLATPEKDMRHLLNECRIYSLPLMKHSSLPRFYGYKQRTEELTGQIEHLMLIEYGQLGSLQHFLAEHTIDWVAMCKLIRSLVQGLAFLHTELYKENQVKPSIAHRDLCSRHVIVKGDGTCMICDYHMAVYFTNCKLSHFEKGSDSISSSSSLHYFAPELLEGNVNYYSESALKQADIYSLGLILWEVATRCTDLYQGIDVPQYRMPFELELGAQTTLEQMKVLVSRNKARPLFPDIWKDSNPAIRLLKETIVECWDHEPEARLTALCVEQRVSELSILWKRFKMETLSNCCIISTLPHTPSLAQQQYQSLSGQYSLSNCFVNKFENSLHYKHNGHHHLLHHPYHKHHFYQTSRNNSKKRDLNLNFEKNIQKCAMSSKNGNVDELPKLTLPLQPHQARNPCIERNLMLQPSDEHKGLLEQGLKFQNKTYLRENISNNRTPQDGVSQINSMPDDQLYDSDSQMFRSLPLPITYVQNPVRGHCVTRGSSKMKETNKHQNQSDANHLSGGSRLLSYLKQKLSLAPLTKFGRDKANPKRMGSGSNSLDEEWKENCIGDAHLDAARLGILIYTKEFDLNSPLTYSKAANSGGCDSIVNDTPPIATIANNDLSSNSSSLISSQCDISLVASHLTIKKNPLAESSYNQMTRMISAIESRINNQLVGDHHVGSSFPNQDKLQHDSVNEMSADKSPLLAAP